ncbi:SRPBCC family protein [Leucobacter viscericola]|uniref:SRPBCC family protein n=1 Tax=Leucobacter viscericola TaxID=2714935 RepID=A0A6G7XE55_9MICO|nr:SRPBCC family protein [Leucobacter viscericola]QIK62874.1 SRPBCC family protein [Leucobacter viscericola]
MSIEATGRVVKTARGVDLVLVRSLALPIEDAWSYLTVSERTAEWFGAWDGDGRAGGSVRIRMAFEEDGPPVRANVIACEAPHRLELHTTTNDDGWELELFLEEDGEDDSLLRFVHHLDSGAAVGDIGPGWEYYLDLLVAATEGTEQPNFDQYYPAMSEAFLSQLG